MGENDNINVRSHFANQKTFRMNLETYQQQIGPILDDYEKYYVFYNMVPSNEEYKKMFDNIQANMNSVNSQVFMLSNNVAKGTDEANAILIYLDAEIQNEKEKNAALKRKLNALDEKELSSDILIANFKELYDLWYLKNWAMIISIVVVGYALSKYAMPKMKLSSTTTAATKVPSSKYGSRVTSPNYGSRLSPVTMRSRI